MRESHGVIRRQEVVTSGYTTKDDWGTDGMTSSSFNNTPANSSGDDTKHSGIPYFKIPGYYQAQGGFPKDGSDPKTVDVVFFDLYVQFL